MVWVGENCLVSWRGIISLIMAICHCLKDKLQHEERVFCKYPDAGIVQKLSIFQHQYRQYPLDFKKISGLIQR